VNASKHFTNQPEGIFMDAVNIHFDATTIPITQLDLLFYIASEIRALRKIVLTEYAERKNIGYDEALKQHAEEQKSQRKKLVDELWMRYQKADIPLPPGVLAPE
jgi:hypothetical protein